MRTITCSLIAAFFSVATLCSCSKSDIPVSGYPTDAVVRISPTVIAPVTRADAGKPFNGSSLGLGMYYGENDKYNRTSSLWTKDGFGNWNSETPVLWKNAEDEVMVYAFVPYSFGGYISGSIPSDQSAGLDDADWLWYSEMVKPMDVLNEDGKLVIELNHALLKLTVNLDYGSEFEDNKVPVKAVWLNGTNRSVNCDLLYERRGCLTSPTRSWPMDIKMHKVSDLCYEAIFYPSVGQEKGGDMLTVILDNGRDFHLKLTEDLQFEKDPRNGNYLGGTAYSMNVKIGSDRIKLTKMSVDESPGWTTAAGL